MKCVFSILCCLCIGVLAFPGETERGKDQLIQTLRLEVENELKWLEDKISENVERQERYGDEVRQLREESKALSHQITSTLQVEDYTIFLNIVRQISKVVEQPITDGNKPVDQKIIEMQIQGLRGRTDRYIQLLQEQIENNQVLKKEFGRKISELRILRQDAENLTGQEALLSLRSIKQESIQMLIKLAA